MKQQDWYSADIIAALKKKGTSLSALSRQSGYALLLNMRSEPIWYSHYANKNRVLRRKK